MLQRMGLTMVLLAACACCLVLVTTASTGDRGLLDVASMPAPAVIASVGR